MKYIYKKNLSLCLPFWIYFTVVFSEFAQKKKKKIVGSAIKFPTWNCIKQHDNLMFKSWGE